MWDAEFTNPEDVHVMTSTYDWRGDIHPDEPTALRQELSSARSAVVHYCRDVQESDAFSCLVPGSPAVTIAGKVADLTRAEQVWFSVVFAGNPDPEKGSRGLPEFGRTFAQILADYQAQWDISDSCAAGRSLDDTGAPGLVGSGPGPNLRWTYLCMISTTRDLGGEILLGRWLLGKP